MNLRIILVAAVSLSLAGILLVVAERRADTGARRVTAAESRAATDTRTASDPGAEPASASGSETGEVVVPLKRDRYTDARVVDVRIVRDAAGRPVERWRLVVGSKHPDRTVRLVETLAEAADADTWEVTKQEAMWADSIVVVVPEGTAAADMVDELAALGYPARRTPDGSDIAIDLCLPDASLDAVPSALAALDGRWPGVAVEPNYLYYPTQSTPSEYVAELLWGLENIEAPAAWTLTTGSTEVVVAVIDTGLDMTHPDIVANLWTNPGETAGNNVDDDGDGKIDDVHGWSFVESSGAVTDSDGHGTHVSGTIGAVGDNGVGMTGVNWTVRILPIRAGSDSFDSTSTLNSVSYINTLIGKGVNIVAVNASWGGSSYSSSFRSQLNTLRTNGAMFVAAAGNDATNNNTSAFYPASYDLDNVIAVASLHQGNTLSGFSNYGSTSVDLAAPGTGIYSTIPDSSYAVYDGTSMAAPHVTGALALLASSEPDLTVTERRTRLLESVVEESALSGKVASGGRLNLRRLIRPGVPKVAVEISEPASAVTILDRTGLGIDFTGEALEDDGTVPDAALTWTVEGDSASTAVVTTSDDGASAHIVFADAGRYVVRLTGEANDLSGSDTAVVLVADTASPTDGLAAWWRFEESGTSVADSSGNGLTGTGTGTTHVTGVSGQAIDFNGATSNVRFAAPSLSQVTISAWARADTEGNSIFPRVVHMQDGLLFFGLGVKADSDGNYDTLKFALDNGEDGRVWHAAPGSLTTGTWYHVAVAHDATDSDSTPRLYIDGVEQITSLQSGTGTASDPTVSAGVGYLGDRGDATRAWDGPLDEVRLYSRPLEASEILVLAKEIEIAAVASASVDGVALAVGGSGSATLAFSSGSLPSDATVTWSVDDTSVAEITSSSSTGATLSGLTFGQTWVRATITYEEVSYICTAAVDVSGTVAAGIYEASSDGVQVKIWFDESGQVVLVAGGEGLPGVYGTGFSVDEYGNFSFVDEAGTTVTGSFDGAGGFTITIGSVTVSGSSVVQTTSNTAALSVFEGYQVDGAARARAVLDGDGEITLVVIETEALGGTLVEMETSGDGAYGDASGGTVASGSLESDVFDATIAGDSDARFVLVREGVEKERRIANISARGLAGSGDDSMIAGFIVTGSGTQVLLRAVGPGLVQFGVDGVLASPSLELHDQSGSVIDENEKWYTSADASTIAALTTSLGIFDLVDGEDDAALLRTLPAGQFTAVISAPVGTTGVVLAEAYDTADVSNGMVLSNISARCRVGTGDDVLIAGFIVDGEVPQLFLLRAVGPRLADFGVSGTLADPVIELHHGSSTIASNDDWSDSSEADRIAAITSAMSAFSLVEGATDAALLIYLEPGSYTAIVRGVGNTEGVALAEVYRVEE